MARTKKKLFTAPRPSPAAVRQADNTAREHWLQFCLAMSRDVRKRGSPEAPAGSANAPFPPSAHPCPAKWKISAWPDSAEIPAASAFSPDKRVALPKKRDTLNTSVSADASAGRVTPPDDFAEGTETSSADASARIKPGLGNSPIPGPVVSINEYRRIRRSEEHTSELQSPMY